MRRIISVIIGILFSGHMMYSQSRAGNEDGILIMFWNTENFFDWRDGGGGESDQEFSSAGVRHWTRKRFYAKCRAIAKTVLWEESVFGSLPDIIGLAEVENAFVLRQLLSSTILRKLDYGTVHYDSPDPRGIDCALLYRKNRVKLLDSVPFRVEAPGLVTRDILGCCFLTEGGDSLSVLVNHHPSKYGGGEDWRRDAAAKRLRELSDSLSYAGFDKRVAIGDFNDGPQSQSLSFLPPSLIHCRRTGHDGSIRFNGEWELIDLCFVSPALAGAAEYEVSAVPFLTARDAAHSGEKPLRTYSGPRYLGGVSDHYPIVVRIQM